MQEKDFISYEYKTKVIKTQEQTRAMDMYEAFGWEITDVSTSLDGRTTLSLKRDRKLKHRQELNRLERQAEDTFNMIGKLNRSKTLGAGIFAYTFGIIAALVLGGGMCLTMLTENSAPALVGGIILGIAGIALCAVNYPIYKKIAEKKTAQILPVIDDNEEKLAKAAAHTSDRGERYTCMNRRKPPYPQTEICIRAYRAISHRCRAL